MTSFIRVAGQPEAGYREEPARHAIIIALVALVLAGLAMGLFTSQSFKSNNSQAAMISNLMVVLCGDKDPTPVVNTGTLHQ